MDPVKISEIMPKVKIEKKPQEEVMQLPVVKKESTKIPTSMQAMELSLIFNTSSEERKQRWCQRSLKNDYYIKAAAPTANDPDQPGLIREEDLNTLLVCFLLLKHSRTKRDKYTFETTPYQILNFFRGNKPGSLPKEFIGGSGYAQMKDSLCRMQSNHIETNFWWDTINGERIIKNNFNFVSSVVEGEKKSLRISLNKDIVESLEQGYIKFLEESSLRDILKLRGHAKVLALFLLKLLGSKPRQDLNLKTVLRYLGVEDKYKQLPVKFCNLNVKRHIIPAMEKASNAIGLSCVYNKDSQQFHLRRIGKIKQIESREGKLPVGAEVKRIEQDGQDPLLIQRKNETFRKLTDIGVASEMIIKLFGEADIDEVERQIEWLPYRKSDNPAGVIVSAIHNHWVMPLEYEQKREEALISRA